MAFGDTNSTIGFGASGAVSPDPLCNICETHDPLKHIVQGKIVCIDAETVQKIAACTVPAWLETPFVGIASKQCLARVGLDEGEFVYYTNRLHGAMAPHGCVELLVCDQHHKLCTWVPLSKYIPGKINPGRCRLKYKDTGNVYWASGYTCWTADTEKLALNEASRRLASTDLDDGLYHGLDSGDFINKHEVRDSQVLEPALEDYDY